LPPCFTLFPYTTLFRSMIKYTLLDAVIPVQLRISPFLAFRGYHTLSKANTFVNKKFKKVDRGAKFKLYENYSPLFLQVSKENKRSEEHTSELQSRENLV